MRPIMPLSANDRERYEWQLDVPGFGEEGQKKLKASTVLISRLGGLGGLVAYELAAAGVGRLVIAHGGNLKVGDLNRQLLMTTDWIGKPRIDSAARRLLELNPTIELTIVNENMNDENADNLVKDVDVVVDCAPLFSERFAMNRAAVRHKKHMVDCAMYSLEAQLTTFLPGKTPCLSCLYPENPPSWKRRFPVLGAVSGAVACLGAMETIKVITGLGDPLYNTLLFMDTEAMDFRKVTINRKIDCSVCKHIANG